MKKHETRQRDLQAVFMDEKRCPSGRGALQAIQVQAREHRRLELLLHTVDTARNRAVADSTPAAELYALSMSMRAQAFPLSAVFLCKIIRVPCLV